MVDAIAIEEGIVLAEQAITALTTLLGQINAAQAAGDQATLDTLHKQAIAAANAAKPVGGDPAVPVEGQ